MRLRVPLEINCCAFLVVLGRRHHSSSSPLLLLLRTSTPPLQWPGFSGVHSFLPERALLRTFPGHLIIERIKSAGRHQFQWQRWRSCSARPDPQQQQQHESGGGGPTGADCQREDNRRIRQLQEVVDVLCLRGRVFRNAKVDIIP